MLSQKKVVLKAEKEKSLLRRHPWIFSGAIASFPDFSDGEILPVYSACGKFLAQAYFHTQNSLSGRVLSFTEDPVEKILKERFHKAFEMRRRFFSAQHTNAYRLINAEGDGMPGLIVDRYHDTLVIQINTAGMERLKPLIIETLVALFEPKTIYEKSTSASRRQEGLPDCEGVAWGEAQHEKEILENGVRFLVSFVEGQKTGFFLDQREMRKMISEYSLNRRVLNCFSYSGGFSLFALKGGAARVDSVDLCGKALQLAKQNTLLNGYPTDQHQIIQEDVFDYLKRSLLDYDLVILDPPAFAKKRADLLPACSGYKEINRLVLEKIPAGSLLLTSSCSYYIDEKLFQNLIFQAAHEAGRQVQILGRHLQALDHPISLYHPEGDYLKSLFLLVN